MNSKEIAKLELWIVTGGIIIAFLFSLIDRSFAPINANSILRLPANNFIRTHRAFIIAKNKICKFDRTQVWINDQIIPIGTTYSQSLQKL